MDILKRQIQPEVYNNLIKANIGSLSTILGTDRNRLSQLLRLNHKVIDSLILQASNILLKKKFICASYVKDFNRLTTGCESIDLIMHGGIPANGIMEVHGSSGAGKTQFCLQLALTVQFPTYLGGFNRGCVYICTEDAFPSKRLHYLAKSFPLRFSNLDKINYEDNIFIKHIADYEQLRRCLYIELPKLLSFHKIGLIIIDSIAGAFRSENVEINYVVRSQEFYTLITQLNKLSEKYGLLVICVNQVSDNIITKKSQACLGLAWTNLITYRMNIKKLPDTVRIFETCFAPDLPCTSCNFKIIDIGLI